MMNHARSKDLGMIAGVAKNFSPEISLELFRKMCISRAFEFRTKKAYDEKFIKMPVYLSVGQEAVSSALSLSFPDPYIFGQHRAHDLYLAYGAKPEELVDELLHKPTGCAKGMGGSASIHSPAIHMFGHSGLLGDQVPIATGFALGSQKKTLVVMGDAAAEEDYTLGALGYAFHKKLPILFVCIDNNLSVLTKTEVRRTWHIADVAEGFGISSVDITDDPWLIMHHVAQMSEKLPALLNIRTVRHLWHAGTGVDGPPEWDRFALVKETLGVLGLGEKFGAIEESARETVDAWWDAGLSSGITSTQK